MTRSPVTESNCRPSPYHSCRFRPKRSGWVGLAQVRRISLSAWDELRRLLSEVVVTWFVTGLQCLLFRMGRGTRPCARSLAKAVSTCNDAFGAGVADFRP